MTCFSTIPHTTLLIESINAHIALQQALTRYNTKPHTMGKHYYSTGRGGAGNITSANEQPQPNLVPQGSQTPNLIQPVFSTGRGGAGNMIKNKDPKLARKLQDVDDDYIEPIESNHSNHHHQNNNPNLSIGRGGFGNIISPKNSRNKDSEKHEKSASHSGFLSKAKKLFSK